MIYIVATLTIKPGFRDAFIEALEKLENHIRHERGNLGYGAYVDWQPTIPDQQVLGPDRIVLVERWQTVADQQRHWHSPFMRRHTRDVESFIAAVEQRVLTSAEFSKENSSL